MKNLLISILILILIFSANDEMHQRRAALKGGGRGAEGVPEERLVLWGREDAGEMCEEKDQD